MVASSVASDGGSGAGGAEETHGAEIGDRVGNRRALFAPIATVANSCDLGVASAVAVVARRALKASSDVGGAVLGIVGTGGARGGRGSTLEAVESRWAKASVATKNSN